MPCALVKAHSYNHSPPPTTRPCRRHNPGTPTLHTNENDSRYHHHNSGLSIRTDVGTMDDGRIGSDPPQSGLPRAETAPDHSQNRASSSRRGPGEDPGSVLPSCSRRRWGSWIGMHPDQGQLDITDVMGRPISLSPAVMTADLLCRPDQGGYPQHCRRRPVGPMHRDAGGPCSPEGRVPPHRGEVTDARAAHPTSRPARARRPGPTAGGAGFDPPSSTRPDAGRWTGASEIAVTHGGAIGVVSRFRCGGGW